MKKFEAVYEVGPHQAIEIVVDSGNVFSAKKKVNKIAKEEYRSPAFVGIRELVPVDRLDHEHELTVRDNKIFELETQLSSIRHIVGGNK